jgi:hypothetical protein
MSKQTDENEELEMQFEKIWPLLTGPKRNKHGYNRASALMMFKTLWREARWNPDGKFGRSNPALN